MSLLAGSTFNRSGYIQYNGYSFLPPRFSFKVGMRPKMSEDGRTSVGNVYRFTVRAIVSDDINPQTRSHLQFTGQITGGSVATPYTDTALQNDVWTARGNLQRIRSVLTQPGCRLIINGMGWDLDLNSGASTAIFDSDYGPRTLDLQFVQMGNGVLWEVIWVFEFTLAECPNSDGTGTVFQSAQTAGDYDKSYIGFPYFLRGTSQMGILEQLSFTVNFTISPNGLTTRVISGLLSCPLNRADTIGMGAHYETPVTADDLWDSIAPEVPIGYQRLTRQREISPDMRHLRFSIVDQELASENDLPPGVVDIQVDHSVQLSGAIIQGPLPIGCNLSGYIEVIKGYSKADAFNKLVLILQQRIDYAKASWIASYGIPPVGMVPVYLTEVSITESLYGPRRIQFSFNYVIVPGTNPQSLYNNLIGATGLFQQVNISGVDWYTWSSAMSSAWNNRGFSRLLFEPDNAPIVGPCEGVSSATTNEPQTFVGNSSSGGTILSTCPPTGYDYLLWQNRLYTSSSPDYMVHSPMSVYSSSSASSAALFSSLGTLTSTDGEIYYPNTIANNPDSPVQPAIPRVQRMRTVSVLKFCFAGKGVRLGNPVEIPAIVADATLASLLGSTKIIPDGSPEKWSDRAGTMGGCPVFAARWKICYKIIGAANDTQVASIFSYLQSLLSNTQTDTTGAKIGGFYNSSSSGP